eukprot:3933650-Rhodomonas_salina.1
MLLCELRKRFHSEQRRGARHVHLTSAFDPRACALTRARALCVDGGAQKQHGRHGKGLLPPAYARPMPCPVLTSRTVLTSSAMRLRARYGMSGTDLAYGATSNGARTSWMLPPIQ